MLGPGGAALVIVAGGVPATVVAGTILMVLALVAILPIHAAPDLTRPRAAAGRDVRSRQTSVLQSVRDLLAMPHARVIVAQFAGQRFVRGVITVAFVPAAYDLLGLGDSGVGILTSAIGFGGLLGGVVALGLVSRQRLAPAFAAGLIAWGAGIVAGRRSCPWLRSSSCSSRSRGSQDDPRHRGVHVAPADRPQRSPAATCSPCSEGGHRRLPWRSVRSRPRCSRSASEPPARWSSRARCRWSSSRSPGRILRSADDEAWSPSRRSGC
jgi:hypothetical protein